MTLGRKIMRGAERRQIEDGEEEGDALWDFEAGRLRRLKD
jgi:hypothetical protein